MTEWMPPPATPKLARQFTCPACQARLALKYEPGFDGHLVPTMFDCPACDRPCSADLPGHLTEVSPMEKCG